ncbi:MAG: ATP-binding protein [Pseudomonadota bacterium]
MLSRFVQQLIMIGAVAATALGARWSGFGPFATLAALAVTSVLLAGLFFALERRRPPGGHGIDLPVAGGRDEPLRPGARQMLARLPVPLFLIEQTGRLSYANAAAQDMFPLLRRDQHFSSVLRAPAFLDRVGAMLRGEAQAEADLPVTLPGRELFLRMHLSRLPGQGKGQQGPVLVVIEDHTLDRRLEQLRADFVANASHELRTPLTAIIGYIETLRDHARDDAEARERFLGIMAQQASRMARLVDDLMSLNRIEMSEHTPPRDVWDIADLLREAVAAVTPMARQRKIVLETALDNLRVAVIGDRDQLIQVFVNLIDNALKYGTGPVTIEALPPSPSYPGMQGIGVRDCGPGIARAHLPRLTERFYRVSAETSRNRGGTGLGLAIVKHVLNRHRGELQVESWPGSGSRFSVWLPARADTGAAETAANSPGPVGDAKELAHPITQAAGAAQAGAAQAGVVQVGVVQAGVVQAGVVQAGAQDRATQDGAASALSNASGR